MPVNETLPVVYVRGFAGDTRGIDKAVADPFYGFNEGSTHIRVGAGNKPSFYQFESPLLRLLLDEGYEIRVQGGQEAYLDAAEKVPANTVWVHRFYDAAASSWGAQPEEYRLENAAGSLLALIEKIRAKAGVPRVHLVAHSMGGLICRCLLQKVLPERGEDPGEYVDKLFTYGTPHGGIAFEHGLGLLERLRDATGVNGADIFGPERMYEYLTPAGLQDRDGPPEGWDPRQMPGGFPPERVFCLVGTNPADYGVAMGLSSAVVGARSDGLVQIDNAYVPGAHRAYVHRSHSGSYGLVNSEEGYQNLRRFLFGDLRVASTLVGHRLPADDQVEWQAEVRLSVRGLPIVMHEQTASHWCPVQLPRTRTDGGPERDVPLVTTFLCSRLAPREGAGPVRHALHLRVLSLRRGRHGLSGRGQPGNPASSDRQPISRAQHGIRRIRRRRGRSGAWSGERSQATVFQDPTRERVRGQTVGDTVTTAGRTDDAWSFVPVLGGHVSNIFIDHPAVWLPDVGEC
ncbi:esterase/lipase family protein [Kitasatospora herbaricolor]|uniref:esterase/lipase family protein n=1 Tax=Kitasatospora herbaricolor TaxID=68217 RepID=UPI0036DD1F2B